MNETRETTTPCSKFASLFQHPLLEDEPVRKTAATRNERAALMSKAAMVCAACPLREACLTNAVVLYDVAGFVAGTTETQRHQIRARLGVSIHPVDNDTFAGVNSGRAFNHEEIARLRSANPTMSLNAIASRMGCSLSTVKRHLRRANAEAVGEAKPKCLRPTKQQVMAAAAEVLGPRTAVA